MKINILKKLPKFILKLPKLLFWFTLAITVISLITIFIPINRYRFPQWYDLIATIHDFTFLFLFFIFPFLLLLFILSFFTDIKRKFLGWTLLLAILGFLSTPLSYVDTRPDKIRMADLKQIQVTEKTYFEDHQQYANYNELFSSQYMSSIPRDPETDDYYPLLLIEGKQNFEVKAKLYRGGWYVCNKDECKQQEEE